MSKVNVEELVTRAEITDVVHRYATGIDRRDWALYRSIFADEVELDFSTWGSPPRRIPADDWVAGVRDSLSGFDATQHSMSNHVVTLLGEEATCVTYMQALHYLVQGERREMQSLGGYYTNRLRRTPDGWKIFSCTLTVTWHMGDRGLFDIARERWAQAQRQATPMAVG